MHPLEKGDFTVNLDDSTLIIPGEKLEVGENTIRISAGGYQDKEMKVDYGKTVEETVLEVEAGNVGESCYCNWLQGKMPQVTSGNI